MPSISELYQSVIVEHDRRPKNCRALDAPSNQATGRNPFCGDEVKVELRIDESGQIAEAAFQGKGCAISRASASLMTVALAGKSADEARELFDRFHALVTGKAVDSASLGKLAVFAGVSDFPMRVKCATLAWHAMKEALTYSGNHPTIHGEDADAVP